MNAVKAIRDEARKKAIYAFSTAYIFERRAILLGRQLRILAVIALFVPLLVAGVVMGFGVKSPAVPAVLLFSGVAGTIQLLGFGVSLACKWEDRYAYALESKNANYSLAGHYDNLAKTPLPAEEAQPRIDLLDVEYKARESQDHKQQITDEEKRMGMCAALRQYQWECAGCQKKPISLESSTCPVCGKFKTRKVIL